MHYTTLPLLFSAIPLALAQYGYGSSSDTTSSLASAPTTTGSSSGPVHTVTVGANNELAFSPNEITANEGDTIEFHFYGPKHSVAQSTFASPCQPANQNAFFSGAISTTGSGANSNIWTLTVNSSSTAIWIYCSVASHCESGMAAVINAPTDGSKTLEMYQQAAMNVGSTVIPTTVQGLVEGTLSSTSTSSSASNSATKNAGVEARGGVKWTALGLTGVVAAGFGGLII